MVKLIAPFMMLFVFTAYSSTASNTSSPISIMTFNIENGGTQVSFKKIVEVIKKSGADVVGIQEPWGNTFRLAKELGWKYYNPAQHLISRFPLYETSHHNYTFVEISKRRFIAIANVHLPNENYASDLIKAGKNAKEIVASERAARLSAISPLIEELTALANHHVPVFLVGDFNAGSHLDWTEATLGKLPHHTMVLEWPITKKLQEQGFIDAYRQTHPNTVQSPGYTWSAKRPVVKNTPDNFNPSITDISERIDFVFSAGPVKVLNSKIVGEADNQGIDLAITPWPSDHRALVAKFTVVPGRVAEKALIATSLEPNSDLLPNIFISKKVVKVNEPFIIRWENAPGNRFDYININSTAKNLNTCIYTKATKKGNIQYTNDKKISGSDCFGKVWPWPLDPGVYTISLMLDDGNKVLSSETLRVL